MKSSGLLVKPGAMIVMPFLILSVGFYSNINIYLAKLKFLYY